MLTIAQYILFLNKLPKTVNIAGLKIAREIVQISVIHNSRLASLVFQKTEHIGWRLTSRASQPLFRKIEGTVKVAELGTADGNSNRLPRTATFQFF
jgi:hypothetical protein